MMKRGIAFVLLGMLAFAGGCASMNREGDQKLNSGVVANQRTGMPAANSVTPAGGTLTQGPPAGTVPSVQPASGTMGSFR